MNRIKSLLASEGAAEAMATLFLYVTILLVGLTFASMNLSAQELTAEPPAEVTAEAPVTEPPAAQPEPTPNVTFSVLGLLGYTLVAVASGALGLGVIARRIYENPAALKTAEALGNSVPVEHADRLISLVDNVIPLFTLLREMFDRVPAETKPPAEQAVALAAQELAAIQPGKASKSLRARSEDVIGGGKVNP